MTQGGIRSKREWGKAVCWGLWAMGGMMAAGCAGSLKSHYADVARIVQERTGQPASWPERAQAEAQAGPVPGQILTVADVERITLANNRALRAELGEIGIARADLIQAALPANPRFAGRYRWATEKDASDNELALNEEFMGMLVIPMRRHAARRQLEQAKARVAGAALELAGQARVAFYTLQGQIQGRDQQRELIDALAADAETARRKRLAGELGEAAMTARELALNQARQDLAAMERLIATEREKLNRLMGLAGGPAATWRIGGELPPPPQHEPPPGDLERLALERRLDLAAIRNENAAIHETLKLQQVTRWIPILVVGVDYERKTTGTKVVGPTLALELPIFDWGQARIARTRALLGQNEQRMAALETDIRSEVRDAQAQLAAMQREEQTWRETLLPQYQRLANLVRTGGGTGTSGGDGLKAQLDAAKAQQEYIQSLKNYWIAHTRVGEVTGGWGDASQSLLRGPQSN